MTDVSQSVALTVFNPASIEAYKDGLAAEVEKVATEARALAAGADVSTPDGQQVLRSTAYKVARSKTALDELGGKLVEEQKATVRAVDASRKKMRDQLDVLRDEVRRPLTEFEERERNRLGEHEAMIRSVEAVGVISFGVTSAEIQQRLDSLNRIPARDWEEFFERYAAARLRTSTALEAALEAALRAEAEKAELDKLRAEAVEHERREREAERIKVAAEKAAALALAREREQREAAEEHARAAEEQVKLAQERQKALTRAAEERAEAEAAARARAAEEEAERKKREAETKAMVNAGVESALAGWLREQFYGDEPVPDLFQTATGLRRFISDGKVPHVSITY